MTKCSLEENVLEPKLAGAVNNEKEEELKPPGLEDYVDERVLSGEVTDIITLLTRRNEEHVYVFRTTEWPSDVEREESYDNLPDDTEFFVLRDHFGTPVCMTDTFEGATGVCAKHEFVMHRVH